MDKLYGAKKTGTEYVFQRALGASFGTDFILPSFALQVQDVW